MDWLLNNSHRIILFLALSYLTFCYVQNFMKKRGMNWNDFKSYFKSKLKETLEHLFPKIVTSIVFTFLISLISFREYWINDVFHVVFLTIILHRYLEDKLRQLLF